MGLREKLRAKAGGRTPRRLETEVALTRAEAAAIRERRRQGAHPSEPFDDDPRGYESVRRAMHAATIDPPTDATLAPVTAPEEVADFASASSGDMESFVTGGGQSEADMTAFVSGASSDETTDDIVGGLLGESIEADDWLDLGGDLL